MVIWIFHGFAVNEVSMLVWITQKKKKNTQLIFPPKATHSKNIKQLVIPDPIEQEENGLQTHTT